MMEKVKLLNEIRISSKSLLIGFLYVILISLLYFNVIKHMISGWNKEDYSYCYLIPFVVIYLIWVKRKVLTELASKPSWMGIIPFGLGIAFFWLGELGGEFFTLYISLWLIIVGIIWLHLGWEKTKVLAFSLFMILTMFPLPNFLYNKISVKLQLISSKLGVGLLHLYGMTAYREGNVIDLGFTQLQVVEACSGLRYLISLVILSILLAYFFKDRFWKRAILIISSIPISIIMNSLRIAVTGVLYEVWGAKVAEGFFHGFSGWLIFLGAFAIMLSELWILRRMLPILKLREDKREEMITGERGEERIKVKNNDSKSIPSKVSPLTIFRNQHFIVAIIIIGVTFVLSNGVEFREKVPIRKPLEKFPLEINEWNGKRDTMEQRFIVELDLSDYMIANYQDKMGKEVNFYIAYYESQRKGESIHSPETCLPGSGWEFHEAGTTIIQVGPDKGIKVNRAFMAKPGIKQLVYFWFPQRGRILTNAYQLKIYNFWDALTRHRTDGSLVRLITPVYPDEDLVDAEKRLQQFTRQIVPLLSEFLPE
jgi:exosortase D (VPLPA-CTERM-specific)